MVIVQERDGAGMIAEQQPLVMAGRYWYRLRIQFAQIVSNNGDGLEAPEEYLVLPDLLFELCNKLTNNTLLHILAVDDWEMEEIMRPTMIIDRLVKNCNTFSPIPIVLL